MGWMDLFITQPSAPTKNSGFSAVDILTGRVSPMNYSDSVSPPVSPPVSYPPSAGALNKPRAAAIDYLNADIAKHYKMGKASAYQEALANTSYQRSVADMKAAGLNPAAIFGAGRGAGASSSVYASSGRSGGSSGRGYYNKQEEEKKAFSSSEYSLFSAIGGLLGIALTGRPDGYWVGSGIAQGGMNLIDALGADSGLGKWLKDNAFISKSSARSTWRR